MAWVAGADGCKAGWLRVSLCLETRSVRADVSAQALALLELPPGPELLGIDVPIGLPDRGSRTCDVAARKLLGRPRGSSVFPAPIRSVLGTTSYADACDAHERVDGRRLSRQAFAILPKIREVDAWLRPCAEARRRVFEVHPEVSFATLAGEPLAEPKRGRSGRERRRRLLAGWIGEEQLSHAYHSVRGAGLGEDDFLDACAAAWTAERLAFGSHRTLPVDPPLDSEGLPMRIVA